MTEHRIIVCGSRGWTDREAIRSFLTEQDREHEHVVVVHGAAPGADRIAGEEAKRLGLKVEEHPAQWAMHGRRAGLLRNERMLALGCTRVVAFWDGESRGTEHMIRKAREAHAWVTVVRERGSVAA